MRRHRLDPDPDDEADRLQAGFAAALIATAGTIGAIIPPSMTMVIYGAIAQVSIGGLFLGGIIPEILVGIALMITVKLYTYHPDYPELRESPGASISARFGIPFAPRGRACWRRSSSSAASCRGSSPLPRPALSPASTPSSSAISSSARSRAELVPILVDAAITTAMVSGIIAVSGPMGWLLSYLQFNDIALAFVTSLSQNPTVVLLIIARHARARHLRRLADRPPGPRPVAISISKTYGLDVYRSGS